MSTSLPQSAGTPVTTLPESGRIRGRRQVLSAALNVRVPNVRWTLDRAFDVIEKSVFALRNLPGPLAELQQRIERAKGLPDEALPTLAKALCRACLEGSESSAALAVFHETDSTEDLQRALKEKVEHHGAEEIAIAAIQAELERRAS